MHLEIISLNIILNKINLGNIFSVLVLYSLVLADVIKLNYSFSTPNVALIVTL